MVISYSRNVGLSLDANVALMLRREARRLASALERRAHMLVLKLECKATQACVMILKRDPEVCVLRSSTTITFGAERDPSIVLLMKFAFEV